MKMTKLSHTKLEKCTEMKIQRDAIKDGVNIDTNPKIDQSLSNKNYLSSSRLHWRKFIQLFENEK